MTSVAAALASCRFVQDTAALVLWGASAYLLRLVPEPLARTLQARLRIGAGVATALAAAATAAELPIEAASVGDGWRDALDSSVVGAVLTGTSGGQAWMVQATAAGLLVLFGLAPPRPRLFGVAGAAALMLVGLSLRGHAVMQEGWLGAVHRANDVLHVLSAGAWFGALVPVLLILPRLSRPAERAEAVMALRRFSRAGHVAVALVLLTGVANAALVLGRWPTNLHSPYEALLDLKVLAVLVMAGLAVVNRYVLLPRLPPSLTALRRATLAEVPLGLLAVALVAVFGLLDPG